MMMRYFEFHKILVYIFIHPIELDSVLIKGVKDKKKTRITVQITHTGTQYIYNSC